MRRTKGVQGKKTALGLTTNALIEVRRIDRVDPPFSHGLLVLAGLHQKMHETREYDPLNARGSPGGLEEWSER
jgi:hypothetical protein